MAFPGILHPWEESRNAQQEENRSAETKKDVLASLQLAESQLGEVH
jgi:hypothetical protein